MSPPGGGGRQTIVTHLPMTLTSVSRDIKTQLGIRSHDTIELRTDTGTLVNDDNVQQLLQDSSSPPILSIAASPS